MIVENLFCLSRINIYIYKMLADSGVECCMLSVQFDIAFYIRCYCNTTYVWRILLSKWKLLK